MPRGSQTDLTRKKKAFASNAFKSQFIFSVSCTFCVSTGPSGCVELKKWLQDWNQKDEKYRKRILRFVKSLKKGKLGKRSERVTFRLSLLDFLDSPVERLGVLRDKEWPETWLRGSKTGTIPNLASLFVSLIFLFFIFFFEIWIFFYFALDPRILVNF